MIDSLVDLEQPHSNRQTDMKCTYDIETDTDVAGRQLKCTDVTTSDLKKKKRISSNNSDFTFKHEAQSARFS